MLKLDYLSLCSVVEDELWRKMQTHAGLGVFARERSKFEGWLKVELVGALAARGYDAVPEKDTIDIVCGDAAIELKTINTSYVYEGVAYKQKPITDNVQSVIEDIEKLEKTAYALKAVVFAAFPLQHGHEEWQNIHLPKIANRLSQMRSIRVEFGRQCIPGIIYTCELGKIQAHALEKP